MSHSGEDTEYVFVPDYYSDYTGIPVTGLIAFDSGIYSQQSFDLITGAIDRASWVFIGIQTYMPYTWDFEPSFDSYPSNPYSEKDGLYQRNSDTFITAGAWGDYRNWLRIESGIIVAPNFTNLDCEYVSDPVGDGEFHSYYMCRKLPAVAKYHGRTDQIFPNENDHVIILSSVGVGGNARIQPDYYRETITTPDGGSVTTTLPTDGWGTLGELYYLSYFKNGETTSKYGFNEKIGPPPNSSQVIQYGPMKDGYINERQIPKCASATFLNNSCIFVDTFNWDYGLHTTGIDNADFININFPCSFFQNSFLSRENGIVSTTNTAYGLIYPATTIVRSAKARIPSFNRDLNFYDNSYIEKSVSAVHVNSRWLGASKKYKDIVGGVRLNCNVSFFGGPREIFLCHNGGSGQGVYFNDQTIYAGGIITNATFNGKSKRPAAKYFDINGVNDNLHGYDPNYFYQFGPHISPTGHAIFKHGSRNYYPLFCSGTFKDRSRCYAPFFNNTIFEGNSIYDWLVGWYDSNFPGKTNGGRWTYGLSNFVLNATGFAQFKGNSLNFASKALTLGPTRFYESGKLAIFKRFSGPNGYLPSNYAGSFRTYDSFFNYEKIGVASDEFISRPSSHNLQYCNESHFKNGQRVPLLSGETPAKVHILSSPPLYHAEFHDFENDGDWYNPNNWKRIGGGDAYKIPYKHSTAIIKSGKLAHTQYGPPIMCDRIFLEDNAILSGDIEVVDRLVNCGILNCNAEYIRELFLIKTGFNIGNIMDVGNLFLADTAVNSGMYFGEPKTGYIKTFVTTMIHPRKDIDIGGIHEYNQYAVVTQPWQHLDNFKEPIPPIQQSIFYNRKYLSFGDYLYQSN